TGSTLMLYLSLLTLPRASAAYQFLESYQLHQLLWKAFPGVPRGEHDKRFLYRHEENNLAHLVLLQSVLPPDWTFLDHDSAGAQAQVKSFDPRLLQPGARLRFFLRANPV